ncbi:MAG: transporter, partial [Planctomycetes bacterium]|nr:transporter [Planctomycetota bacterium]
IAGWSFLDRMALCFGIVVATLTVLTIVAPLKKPVVLPVNEDMDVTPSKGAMVGGGIVIILTIVLYVVFW